MKNNTLGSFLTKKGKNVLHESSEHVVKFEGGELYYTEYISCEKYTPGNATFAIDDIFAFGLADHTDNIIDITSIYISMNQRNKGVGSRIVNEVCDYFKDRLIIGSAGISKAEYTKDEFINMNSDERNEIIENVSRFMEHNNFVDINNMIGLYEDKIAHVYVGNDRGKVFMEAYNKICK